MEDWKDKTCENCNFRINLVCRRFPPQHSNFEAFWGYTQYPKIGSYLNLNETEFSPACAEYKTIQQK